MSEYPDFHGDTPLDSESKETCNDIKDCKCENCKCKDEPSCDCTPDCDCHK